MSYKVIFLLNLIFFVSINSQEINLLLGEDKTRFSIPMKLAKKSVTLKNLIEMTPEDQQSNIEIPLPSLNLETFKKIVELQEIISKEDLQKSELYKLFFKKLRRYNFDKIENVQHLAELINTANFLDIEILKYLIDFVSANESLIYKIKSILCVDDLSETIDKVVLNNSIYVNSAEIKEMHERVSAASAPYNKKIAISADGKFIASILHKHEIVLFDDQGRLCQKLDNIAEFCSNIAINQDGSTVAVSTSDNLVHIYQKRGRLFQKIRQFKSNDDLNLLMSSDGSTLIICSYGNAHIFDINGRLLGKIENIIDCSLNKDGSIIACILSPKSSQIKLFNRNSCMKIREINGNLPYSHVKISDDGLIVVATSGNLLKFSIFNSDGSILNNIESSLASFYEFPEYELYNELIDSVSLNSNGYIITLLIKSYWNHVSGVDIYRNSLLLFNREGQLLQKIQGEHGILTAALMSADGSNIVVSDTTLDLYRRWDDHRAYIYKRRNRLQENKAVVPSKKSYCTLL